MLKFLFVIGARPNFPKVAAIVRACQKYIGKVKLVIVNTEQHYDYEMNKKFFEDFNLPEPIASLGIGSGSRAEQIQKTLVRLKPVLEKERPSVVIVVGDVNSTLGAALAALEIGIPIAHVEAGLRSFNWKMPEESNRVMTDSISNFLFVTETQAINNLKNENVAEEKVFYVGNVMIDSLVSNIEKATEPDFFKKLNLNNNNYGLVTVHRAENVDDEERLKKIFNALSKIQEKVPLLLPLHPRTKERIRQFAINEELMPAIVPPLGYLDFLYLMKNAKFVITDSGGIQEEATFLNIPCITIRDETERPITVSAGTNIISGIESDKIFFEVAKILKDGGKKRQADIPLWDGKTSERIIEILIKKLINETSFHYS